MAEITSSDFKKLIEAQQATTRQLMSIDERAADDAKKEEQRAARSEAARRGHETRLANQEQNTSARLSDEEQSHQEESTGFLGKIANFMGMDKLRGAAEAEDADKQESRDSKMLGYLKSTAGFLGGIAKQGMEKVKSGLGGLKKFLIGGLAVAALAFLNSPKFEEMKERLLNVIIPALAKFYDNVLVPVGDALVKLFDDLMLLLEGEKSLMSVLTDNKLAIAGVVTALAPNLVFGALKTAVTGLVKGVGLLPSAVTSIGALFTKIGAGFTALKATLTTTVWPAITAKLAAIKGIFAAKLVALKGFLVPFTPILAAAAAIGVVLYSLKKAFDDFMFELKATGSIWEATKTGIVSVISNILGLPFDLIKDGVSWIIGKIGSIFGLESFTNASKAMDEFSFVDTIKEGLTFMGDAIAGLFNFIVDFVQKIIRKIPFKGDDIADALFGTTEEQEAAKKAKAEEQKLFEENRKALREQQKLEKEAEEAKKLEKMKEQQAVPKVPIFERLGNPREAQAQSNTIVSAPTTVSAPSTTNVTQMSKSLAPKDRVMDELGFAI